MRLRDGKKAGILLLAALLLTGCGGAENTSDAVMSVNEDTAAGSGRDGHIYDVESSGGWYRNYGL